VADPTSAALGVRLEGLASLALEADSPELAAEATALAARTAEGRFFVAAVGGFKRGKSTLVNALLDVPVLPVGVVPVTSVITIVRYGRELAARVGFVTGDVREVPPTAVAAFVTEAENPGNEKGVAVVEVFVPSPVLASGLCLVDTPGLGSVFQGNTRTTRAFVPQIDAALIVIGADPPISADELALAVEIGRQVDHLIVVLNKADRCSETERAEGAAFAERVLGRELGRPIGPILEVSAAERLATGRPTRDWTTLAATLDTLARKAGAELVEAARRRGLARLTARVAQAIEQRAEALRRPLDESERRLERLRHVVGETERALADLGPLFTAAQDELAAEFAQYRQAFLDRVLEEARSELDRALGGASAEPAGRLRNLAAETARRVARAHVERWRGEIQPVGEALYRQVTGRFIALARDLLARLAEFDDPALVSLEDAVEPETGFRAASEFYFTELFSVAEASPAERLIDGLRSRRRLRHAVRRRAESYLTRLIESNSARVANDLKQRVIESRRRLEADVRASLRQAVALAERALEGARRAQAGGAAAVEAEMARLETIRAKVAALGADGARDLAEAAPRGSE